MSDINQQKDTYRKKYEEFLDSIEGGTASEEITYLKTNYEALKVDDRRAIQEQINTWKSLPEGTGPQAQVKEQTRKNILKDIASRITGPLGIPTNLKDFGARIKSNAIKSLKQAIPNPGVVAGKLFNPRRPRDKATINPENFNKINKEIVSDESKIRELEQQDNGQNHLIVFHITNNNKVLVFRMANFTGFTDSVTPTFSDSKYFGRAEPYYQYQGVSRNVSFSFDVVVHNPQDIYVIYGKVNTLISLAYPHRYTDTNMIEPNILKLSIGKYFIKKPFFMTNMTITGGDETIYYKGKPSILTINIQGNLLEGGEYPTFEGTVLSNYVDNSDVPQGVRGRGKLEEKEIERQARKKERQNEREARRTGRRASRGGADDSTTVDDTFRGF